MPRKLKPCGTNAAYVRHIRHNEPTCQPCRDAHAEYGREHVDGGRPRGEAKCGTQAGYDKHLRRRQETCAECRAAHKQARGQVRQGCAGPGRGVGVRSALGGPAHGSELLAAVGLVPLDGHEHSGEPSVPGDLDVLTPVLSLGDVLRQARLQLARSHGVTERFGHEVSVQARGRYDHNVWLLRLPF